MSRWKRTKELEEISWILIDLVASADWKSLVLEPRQRDINWLHLKSVRETFNRSPTEVLRLIYCFWTPSIQGSWVQHVQGLRRNQGPTVKTLVRVLVFTALQWVYKHRIRGNCCLQFFFPNVSTVGSIKFSSSESLTSLQCLNILKEEIFMLITRHTVYNDV